MAVRQFRAIARALLPARTRRFLNFVGLALDRADSPELVRAPYSRSALVLAPHPDDEVVGCGGTLYLHAQQGTRVCVAYMTDGRMGSLRLLGDALAGSERRKFQEGLVRARKAEAASAAKVLGIGTQIFLDFPDGELRSSRVAVERVANLFETHRPEVVFVPFPTDRQRDHVETARILAASVGEVAQPCEVFAYEVWSPLYPNCMVDITEAIEVKRQAMLQFRTQVAENDFVRSVLGLNAYRAAFHLGSRGYAEAFYRCRSQEFRRLCWHLVGRGS